jgi:predicted glycosyltransferase
LIESGHMLVTKAAVNGLNLVWFSDLVVSGGGTMNREAAALGVPVYSIFRGKIGAVDRYLADHGRMTMVATVAEVHRKINLVRWNRPAHPNTGSRKALDCILNNIVSILHTRQAKRPVQSERGDLERNARAAGGEAW